MADLSSEGLTRHLRRPKAPTIHNARKEDANVLNSNDMVVHHKAEYNERWFVHLWIAVSRLCQRWFQDAVKLRLARSLIMTNMSSVSW